MDKTKLTPAARHALTSAGFDPDGDLVAQLANTRTGPRSLLTASQYKMQLGLERGVSTRAMHLSPAQESGFNACPFAGTCVSLCIKYTGHMVTGGAARARIAKTVWWHIGRESFLDRLHYELSRHEAHARKKGLHPAVRPNGTSDYLWERHGLPQAHPEIDFYDYTKVPLDRRKGLPPNYHLTYSVDEQPGSFDNALDYLAAGHNAAMVVSSPEGTTRGDSKRTIKRILDAGSLFGFPVVDGDTDDLRFMDPPGSWILLAAKGPATTDRSGFVRRIDVSVVGAAA